MSVPSPHYADLCHLTYKEPERDPLTGEYKLLDLDGVAYQPLECHDNEVTGYQGAIYQRMDTGEIVVVHRGTEPNELQDLAADAKMVFRRVNPQLEDARFLTERALTWAKELAADYGHPLEVTVTGHSLGGTLAQLTAHEYKLRGETFDAYGAVGLWYDVPKGGNRVINHVMATDVVSAGSPHFGNVEVYATPKEIAFLAGMGGYELGSLGLGNALTTAIGQGASMHGIHHFSRFHSNLRPDGVSVLQDPQARMLAVQHAPQIAQFRGEIGAIREQITHGAQLGGMIGQGIGHVVAGHTRTRAWALEVAGDIPRMGTELQAKGVKAGAEMAGTVAGRAARDAGEAAAQGRQLWGEGGAAADRLQGMVHKFGAQGAASILRGVAGLLPEEQGRHLDRMAEQVEQSGVQAQARQQVEAQQVRQAAQADAQHLRNQSQTFSDRIEKHLSATGQQVGEIASAHGRLADAYLDRASEQIKQHVVQMPEKGRTVGETFAAIGTLTGGTVMRQALDTPTETAEIIRNAAAWGATLGRSQTARSAELSASSPPLIPFSDARHPQHALYADAKQRLEAQGHYFSDDRLNQITAQLHKSDFRPGWEGQIAVAADKVHALDDRNLWNGRAHIALTEPAPTAQQTMLDVQQHDRDRQQQAIEWQQRQEQARSQSGAMR